MTPFVSSRRTAIESTSRFSILGTCPKDAGAFSHTSLAKYDCTHPHASRTWPAVWEVDPLNWPFGGELDIVEGANDEGTNAATLHTGPGKF